jgi:hypothetical protein
LWVLKRIGEGFVGRQRDVEYLVFVRAQLVEPEGEPFAKHTRRARVGLEAELEPTVLGEHHALPPLQESTSSSRQKAGAVPTSMVQARPHDSPDLPALIPLSQAAKHDSRPASEGTGAASGGIPAPPEMFCRLPGYLQPHRSAKVEFEVTRGRRSRRQQTFS